jgi:spermidine synthase
MTPWKHLDRTAVPGGDTVLHLYQHDQTFSMRIDGIELMNSCLYSTEDAFSVLGCARIQGRSAPRVLIGGLGMGYSLRSALDRLPADAEVVVAELLPKVAQWNRELLGHLAGHPLDDVRVTLREVDVAQVLLEAQAEYDLIMLDVDNGPEGLTRRANDWLYSHPGLLAARAAMRPRGVVGYWSSGPDQGFVRRLKQVGLEVEERSLRAGNGHRGARHTVWLAVARSAQRERVRKHNCATR